MMTHGTTTNGHARVKHPWRRRCMYVGFLGFRAVTGRLPLSIAQALGAMLGLAGYALLGPYRRLVHAHLREVFGPRLSGYTRRFVARHVFINLGKNFIEWQALARLSPAQLQRRVDFVGLTHLQQALAKGRGVIALSAHFGNWEVLAPALTSLGFKGGVLARRLRYPEYEAFLVEMRRRHGVETYARSSIKDVVRVLKANHIIGMMPDQDIDSLDGVFVEFFNRPAYTPVGPAALAVMTGASIVPCFCLRQGRRFRIVIEEPIAVPRTGDRGGHYAKGVVAEEVPGGEAGRDRAQNLAAITQAWSRVVESHIRSHPHQWVWMHRRWKTQPAGAARPQAPAEAPAQAVTA